MEGELRNCPFCGKKIAGKPVFNPVFNNHFIYCEKCDLCVELSIWNSAWCWKEIDRLKDQNERLSKIWIKAGDPRCFYENTEMNKLKSQNSKMREALESISKNSCCGQCQEAKLVAEKALKGE